MSSSTLVHSSRPRRVQPLKREIVKVSGFYTSSLLITLKQSKETYRSCKRLWRKGLHGAYLFFLQS